ncbi:MAG: helix-turn-helix domain-containing protein [Thermoanaerobaculia bacterium]
MKRPDPTTESRSSSADSSGGDVRVIDVIRRGMFSTETMSFGKALRDQRRRRKLSLGELASLSGMSASYLSRIEHGHLPPPSAKIMDRLAMALNMEGGALQTAAGRIPESIVAAIRDKPTVLTLLRLMARLPEDELFDLCNELLERSDVAQ